MTASGKRISTFQATTHLVKAVMGAGSFALPWAFMQAGVLLGPLLLLLTAVLSAYTHVLLARCRRRISAQCGYAKMESGVGDSDEPKVGDVSPSCNTETELPHHGAEMAEYGAEIVPAQQDHADLLSYPAIATATFGLSGGHAVGACTLCASLGVCSAYVVFITDNVCSMLDGACLQWSQRVSVTGFIVGGLMLLSWLRDLRRLAFTSLLGDIAIVAGASVVVWHALHLNTGADAPNPVGSEPVPLVMLSTLPLSFGIIAFLFCTQFLSLPIEGSMQHPEEYPRAVLSAFAITGTLNVVFGMVGAYTWRRSVNPIVILNLEASSLVVAVKACLCIDLFFTFPIVIYPTFEMVESFLVGRCVLAHRDAEDDPWPRNAYRSLLVAVTAGIALSLPHFGLLTDFFAGLGQTLLAFVAPPLLALRLRDGKLSGSSSMLLAIAAYGVTACVLTTATTLLHLAQQPSDSASPDDAPR